MTAQEHSPLPWRLDQDGSNINDADGFDVAFVPGTDSNRRLIVRAVNSHGQLLAAAKDALPYIWGPAPVGDARQAAITAAEEQAP